MYILPKSTASNRHYLGASWPVVVIVVLIIIVINRNSSSGSGSLRRLQWLWKQNVHYHHQWSFSHSATNVGDVLAATTISLFLVTQQLGSTQLELRRSWIEHCPYSTMKSGIFSDVILSKAHWRHGLRDQDWDLRRRFFLLTPKVIDNRVPKTPCPSPFLTYASPSRIIIFVTAIHIHHQLFFIIFTDLVKHTSITHHVFIMFHPKHTIDLPRRVHIFFLMLTHTRSISSSSIPYDPLWATQPSAQWRTR